MAQYWKITEAIHDAMDQGTEAGKQAADEWTGSGQEDRNDYASVVYNDTGTGPDDKPITDGQRTSIERIAAELTKQATAWLAANPAETED